MYHNIYNIIYKCYIDEIVIIVPTNRLLEIFQMYSYVYLY